MDRHHPQPADVERGSWSSLDRFAAKRLRTIADELVPAKRAVIEEKSAFRALLNVSPFNIPNEFIEFVAANTSFQLREFRFNKKRIVFTRDMVKKVFGIRCGNKPVILLKKSDQCELRDVYYRAGSNRAPIRIAVELLKSCEVTDEATIIRTWDLICLATVVDPGSGNMLSLEYLGSMFDPTKTHEFAWDEHMFELAMQEVKKIQHKKAQPLVLEKGATKFEFWISGPFAMLAIVYMDHLQFPPNEHTINYSVPRVCYVKNEDLKFVVTNDLERKILNNTTIFGRRPFLDILDTPYGVEDPITEPDEEVNPSASLNEWLSFPSSQDMEIPPRFKHLHDKHMGIFSADVDAAMKSLGTGLKQMQSQRMTALLIDVDAAMKGAAGSNVEFTTTRDAASEEQEKAQEAEVLHAKARGAVDDVKEQETSQEAKVVDAEEHLPAATDSEVCTLNITDPPQTAVILDSWTIVGGAAERSAVNSPVRSPERSSPRRGISDEAWNNAPDAPSMDLFPEESEEFKDFNSIPDSPSHICVEMTGTACNDKGKAAIELSEVASLKEGPETGGVSEAAKDVEATVDLSKDATPQHTSSTVDGQPGDGSTGVDTLEKRNRYKRAAKEDLSPIRMKKIRVSQDVINIYDKFVINGRRYKRQKKNATPKPFVQIGSYYCTYKSFRDSLRFRQDLDSQVMEVWIQKFNKDSKVISDKYPRHKKKFAFPVFTTTKLIVDPSTFKTKDCMKEFKEACSKFNILKDDLLYFPIVKDHHWIVCCVNLLYKQFHIFDSLRAEKDGTSLLDKAANNLLSNFVRTANESGLSKVDFGAFTHTTPDHPQQTTVFDCGFFSMLFMEHFNAKVMKEFSNENIPDFRKILAATLINNRDNNESVEKLMEEELQFT